MTQAESELGDDKKREEVDAVMKQARVLVLRELKLPPTIDNDDERLRKLSPPFKVQLRTKAKEVLIDEEVRRRKCVVIVVVLS